MGQPSFRLEFSIEGEKSLSRRLMGVSYDLQSFADPFEEIGGGLLKTFQLNFAQEGKLFGGWPERKPVYKNGERVDTWPLLNKTGTMMESFDMAATDTRLVLFNTADWFKYHQSRRRRTSNLPRRVMMMLTNDSKQMIVKTFQKYVSRAITKRR